MSNNIGGAGAAQMKILDMLQRIQDEARGMQGGDAAKQQSPGGMSFGDHLKQGIEEVNATQVKSDKMAMELATGKTGNIHETMLAASQAELSFNLMVQLRNKALEAYTEIMRMPV